MSSRHASSPTHRITAGFVTGAMALSGLAFAAGCASADREGSDEVAPTAEQAEALSFRRSGFDAPIQFIENRVSGHIEDSLIATTTGHYTLTLAEHAGHGFVTVRPPSWLVPQRTPILLEGNAMSSAWTEENDLLVVGTRGDSMEPSVPVKLDVLAAAGIDVSTCQSEGFAAAVIRFSDHEAPRDLIGDGYAFSYLPMNERVVGKPAVTETDAPVFDELFVKHATSTARGSSAMHIVFSVAVVCDTADARRQIEARVDFAVPTN